MSPDGRYAQLPIRHQRLAGGASVRYRARRFLPQPSSVVANQVVAAVAGDRLDLVAARHLGDAAQWWRLCDANSTLSPDDLETAPNRPLRIPDNAPHLAP